MENSGSGFLEQDCNAYRESLLGDITAYEAISFISPRNATAWMERTKLWAIFFNVHIGVLSAVYLVMGIIAVFLIVKRDCARLKVKTFFAVYVAIAILGFSRVAFLVLDPFGLNGFIAMRFPQWIIISRLLAALGFPSLVASYTLMIMTMFKLTSKTRAGKQWYNYNKCVIPICITPYVIVIGAELVGNFVTYPGVLALVLCAAFFSLWGFCTCIAFLIVGGRLQKKILAGRRLRTLRRSSVSGSNIGHSNSEPAMAHYELQQDRALRRKTQKIRKITLGTAAFGLLYSLSTAGQLTMVLLLLYYECLGLNSRGNVTAWLCLQTIKRTLEIILAFVMLYSITDIPSVLKIMTLIAKCRCKARMTMDTECSTSNSMMPNNNMHDPEANVPMPTEQSFMSSNSPTTDETATAETNPDDTQAPLPETNRPTENTSQSDVIDHPPTARPVKNTRSFQIIASKGSDSSIGSSIVESQTSDSVNNRSLPRADDSGVLTSTDAESATNVVVDTTMAIDTTSAQPEQQKSYVKKLQFVFTKSP